MGLEIVEFLLKVEGAYGVHIPVADAAGIVTLGDLYRCIEEGLRPMYGGCASAGLFYRVRRELLALSQIEHRALRPETKISDAISLWGRDSKWKELERALGLELPPLRRPFRFCVALGGSLLLLLVYGSAASLDVLRLSSLQRAGFLAGFMACMFPLVGLVIYRLTRPLAIFPPPFCTTFRDLVRCIIALNYRALKDKESGPLSSEEVWNSLRYLAADHFSVDPGVLSQQTEFVNDLRAD